MAAIVDTGTQIFGVADAELRKLRHDPTELLSRAIQPALWLLLFGQVMAHVRGLSSGTTRYLDFMAPGILAQSVLFVAIFYGISSIWERDLGIVHRYLASPAPRAALVLGKALSAGVRSLSQAVVVYALALVLGIHLSFAPLHVAAVILFISLGGGALLYVLAHHGVPGEDPRAVHGHRAGADNADLLRQQRHLPDQSDAHVAADYLAS